uniref:Uncharacterized protein n=2 Tax=Peronospora matthiolae TaxID=2874970 RepID=A0AAV1T0S9_9STRA
MSHRLLKRLSLCHLVMQALVMKTLMSSQSMSSVSHTLPIRRTDGSVSTAIETKPPAKRGMDDAMRRSIFGSSDESDEPSPKRSRSRCQSSVDTSQEERDRSVLCLAPEKKAWMPPKYVMDHLSATTSESYRTRLFDSSRIHHLEPSAKNYRAENEFFIDAFFEHRWYSGNHERDGPSLLQAWNAYIHNLENVGRDVWNDKLIKARDKFEKRTPTGARYKLHRLSKESGLTCLSWGDSCPCCVNNSARAPKETYLLTSPWWRVRISTEMYEGIDNLKSLYDRAGKTFSGGPSAAQDVPRRTARPDPVRQPSVESGAPKNPRTGDSRATGRGNSSDVRLHRGGSTAAQPDSAGHRESPLMDVKEEDSRLQLADTVLKHRAEFAFAQLENERALTSLRDELRVARVDIDRSRAEITALKTLVDGHHREHKALCEMLERKGVLHRKKQRTDGTA